MISGRGHYNYREMETHWLLGQLEALESPSKSQRDQAEHALSEAPEAVYQHLVQVTLVSTHHQ